MSSTLQPGVKVGQRYTSTSYGAHFRLVEIIKLVNMSNGYELVVFRSLISNHESSLKLTVFNRYYSLSKANIVQEDLANLLK